MNLQTVRTVSKELGVSEMTVRRAVAAKKLQSMSLGNRMLVDLDAARAVLQAAQRGATAQEVSEATGLKVSAIRRGVREGWLPGVKDGRSYMFQIDEVIRAIEKRMAET